MTNFKNIKLFSVADIEQALNNSTLQLLIQNSQLIKHLKIKDAIPSVDSDRPFSDLIKIDMNIRNTKGQFIQIGLKDDPILQRYFLEIYPEYIDMIVSSPKINTNYLNSSSVAESRIAFARYDRHTKCYLLKIGVNGVTEDYDTYKGMINALLDMEFVTTYYWIPHDISEIIPDNYGKIQWQLPPEESIPDDIE